MVQDSDGFMWIGTDIGLSCFDGYRFRNYTIIDGLLENRIVDLQFDKQGRLWITSQGELCYFENNEFHKANIIGTDEKTTITSFKVARNGNLWFTTKDKLFATDSTLNHIVWTSENMDMPLTNPTIQFEDGDGYIWLHNEYDHILKAGEKDIHIIPLKFLPAKNSPFRANIIDNEIYYTSQEGLVKLTQTSTKIVDIPLYKNAKSIENTRQEIFKLPNNNTLQTELPFLLKDSKNTIWTSVEKGNFVALNMSQDSSLVLPDNLIASNIYEDKVGNLWMATKNDGVYVLDASADTSDNDIQLLLEDKKVEKLYTIGKYTLAIVDRQLYKIAGNEVELLDIGKSKMVIKAMTAIGEDDIFWSTEDMLFWYDGREIKNYFLADIQAMSVANDTLYYGTSREAKSVALSDLPTSVDKRSIPVGKSMLKGRSITDIYIDKKENCWIGTETGLHLYSKDETLSYRDKDAIFGHGISSIGETSDGTIWVATKGAGVLAIQGEDYLKINAKGQLDNDYCNDLITEDSVVWVVTNSGINRIGDIHFDDETHYVSRLSNMNRFNMNNIHAVAINDKYILSGTENGLFAIDKRYFHRAYALEKVLITGIEQGNGKSLPLQDDYELTYKENTIRIDYSALDYSYQGNIVYEYKMEGVDTEWKRTRDPATPLYVLAPGTYTFKVKALNGMDKKPSQTATLNIIIKPPFWDSNLFKGLLAVLGIWVVISMYSTYAESKKNAELERLVAQKTADLNKKVVELERSNNELEEFNYVVAHDLKAPLRTIHSFVQLLERRDGDRLSKDGKEYVEYIGKGAKRLQTVITDLLTFSGLNKTGEEKEQVDLNEVLDLAIEHLQGVIRTQEVIIEKDELPTIQAIPLEMLQVFQNLISNGIKYQSVDNQPIVIINVIEKDENWLFSVKDNGIGIDHEYEDKVFRIFQRLHNTEEYSGTGIGLPIVKKIVESNGGEIWFKSALGEGTTFFFTLPMYKSSE